MSKIECACELCGAISGLYLESYGDESSLADSNENLYLCIDATACGIRYAALLNFTPVV